MNVELDTDELQLRDSLRRLLAAESTPASRRAIEYAADWDPALWTKLQELGLGALLLPETLGGFALRPAALLPVMQEVGRALAIEPLLAVIVAQRAVVAATQGAERSEDAVRLLSDSPLIAWAHAEAAGRHDPCWIETEAHASGDGWILDGEKINVVHGAAAQALIVTARSASGVPGVFAVQADASGVHRDQRRLVDGTPVAVIRLQGAYAQKLDLIQGNAQRAIEAAQQLGMAAVCAEAVGVCELAMAQTVEYVNSRKQFDRALGQKQSVRHRVAEMQVGLEMVRSAALGALLALEESDTERRAAELERSKMLVSRHGVFIAQQAIQLHGGVGMTVEYTVGHCLRRMTVIDQLFGDGHFHASSLARRVAQPYATPSRTV